MARNRQRAADRKRRNLDGSVDGVAPDGVDRDPNPIHREMVPGPVEHTGEVDEFEAALVAGADGEPEADPDAAERAALGDGDGDRDAAAADAGAGALPAPTRAEPPARSGNRLTAFFRASWAELQRVQWPDRRQVGQATAVVLGFVVIAGAFLGLADVVAGKLVDLIL